MSQSRLRIRTLVTAAATVLVAAGFVAGSGATTAATAPSNTSPPTISGSAEQGQTLTASSGSWSGTTPLTFAYQWQRCDSGGTSCANISGATSQTYTLQLADVGHTIVVVVKATNSGGSASASSARTAVVTGATPPHNTAAPQISGTATVGSTLTTSKGTWTGTAPISYQYQWRRCDTAGSNCTSISSADNQSYVLVDADSGHTMRVVVTATNAGGQAEATSGQTATVVAGKPANSVAPAVTGTVTQGQTLSVSNGTWTGTSPITYTYAWQRCDSAGNNCASISGATKQTYVLTSADVGAKVRAVVTATNTAGATSAPSNVLGPIVSSGPVLPAGAITLPNGTISIPASSVPDTDRMTVGSVSYSPAAIHGKSPVTAKFTVFDGKYVVRDALVYVLGLPRNWAAKVAEQPTGQDGIATITIIPTTAAPRRGALVLFVRARTPQGNLLAGSSTRRLVQVKINP